MMNSYETVLILNPVLSEEQVQESIKKFKTLLSSFKAELVFDDSLGLKKMKYSIQNKKTGFYVLFEFKSKPNFISDVETELARDERIMRFLTVKLDKGALEYSKKKRNKVTST